jgi:hypothetical protein
MKYSSRQGYDKHMALLVFHTQAGFQAYAQLQRLHLWIEKFQCIRSLGKTLCVDGESLLG